MSYCWEVYQKSECDQCKFYQTFQSGSYDLNKLKDVIIVEDVAVPPAPTPN